MSNITLWLFIKGMVALLTKITVHIKFGILINNTLIKNSKNIPNFLNSKFVTFFDQISNQSCDFRK